MTLINQRESKLLSDGRELFNKNNLKKAYILFDEVININPKSSEAFFYLGNIFHIQGQLGKAVKAFNKVLELDPNHTDASISLSVILNDIGRYEDAKKIFEKASEKVKNEKVGLQDSHINKKFAAKHYEIAEMYFSYNRYEEALSEYSKACGLDPDNLDGRVKIAKVYSKKGYTSKAFEELRKLKSEHPSYTPARVALGLMHFGKGDTLEAQTEWQVALSKDPKNEEILMYLNISKNATETNLNT